MTNNEDLLIYDNEPFMFLEGGTGLNDIELSLYRQLVSKNYEVWSLENLYEKPERLGAIQFLKPKVLIFGTTGVYENKLNILLDFANSIDLSSIEKVILTLDTERKIRKHLSLFSKKYPKIIFYKFRYNYDNDYSIRPITI